MTTPFSDPNGPPPSSFPWPPILVAACVLAGFGLNGLIPLPTGLDLRIPGVVCLALALLIDAWVFEVFRANRTTVRPDRAASTLVTGGPFRWSRNPIYVGNVMIVAGFTGLGNSWWFLPLAVVFVVLVERLAIRPEEAHLEEKFGQEWRDFAARTRRWV